jgi:hypothetical protein
MKAYPVTHRDRSSADKRYTVTMEHCGHPKPRYVARFCGEFLGSSIHYGSAVLFCIGNRSVREGAAIVTEIAAK